MKFKQSLTEFVLKSNGNQFNFKLCHIIRVFYVAALGHHTLDSD